VRNEFRVGRSTFCRMIARFRSSRKASSLTPTGPGTPDGARRLDIRTEHLIGQEIDRFWLKKERPRMSALIRRVQETCRIEGLPPPHRSSIQRRVDELDALGTARRRGEVSLEAEATPGTSSFHAERPNDVWQIDHTTSILIVVDEETRLPIGRPYLTIAIDICTRMVAGFHLSLDAPSSASVGPSSSSVPSPGCRFRPPARSRCSFANAGGLAFQAPLRRPGSIGRSSCGRPRLRDRAA
jgi:putative transposase